MTSRRTRLLLPAPPLLGTLLLLLIAGGFDSLGVVRAQDAVCGAEETAMYTCLDSSIDPLFDADACEQCVAENVPLTPEFCADLASALCPAIRTSCPCEGCRQVIESYVACGVRNVTGCDVMCEDDTDDDDTAGADDDGTTSDNGGSEGEGDVDRCATEREGLGTCLSSMAEEDGTGTATCEECIVNANLQSNSTCAEWTNSICTALTNCPCASCATDIEALYRCSLPYVTDQSCGMNCSAFEASPVPSDGDDSDGGSSPGETETDEGTVGADDETCSDQRTALFACFDDELSEENANTCGDCIGEAVPPLNSTCQEYQTDLCQAMSASCAESCGSCVSRIENFFDCSLAANGIDDCVLTCNLDVPDTTTDDEVISCEQQEVDLMSCLESMEDENMARQCGACVTDAALSNPDKSMTCDGLQTTICSSCYEGCGDQCRGTAAAYLKCASVAGGGDDGAEDCEVECDADTALSNVSPECVQQNIVMDTCLSSTLAEDQDRYNGCISCLDQAYRQSQEDTLLVICVDVSSLLCPAITGDCDCGVGICRNQITDYYDCEINQVASNCHVNCDDSSAGGGSAGESRAYSPYLRSQYFLLPVSLLIALVGAGVTMVL